MPAANPSRSDLQAFFEVMSSDSVDDSAELFHEQFFNLGPGSASLLTREQLRAALPMRARLFRSVGATSTRLRDLETVPLDGSHLLARTTWDVIFDQHVEQGVLESSYLLSEIDGRWQVLAYLNHKDIVSFIAAAKQPRECSSNNR